MMQQSKEAGNFARHNMHFNRNLLNASLTLNALILTMTIK